MSNKVFAVAVCVSLVVVGVVMQQFLRNDTSCGDFAGDPESVAAAQTDPDAVEHTLAVEVAGNTAGWVAEVQRFVTDRLTASGNVAPQAPLVVRVVLIVDGQAHTASDPCLREPLVLEPAEHDRRAYDEGSEQTREAMLRTMGQHRARQIAEVGGTIAGEVAHTDLTAIGSEPVEQAASASEGADTAGPTISPFAPWAAAAQATEGVTEPARQWVSVLSPLHSNAGDCFDTTTSTVADLTPQDLVAGCVDLGGLPKVEAGHVAVDFLRTVATTPEQAAQAQAMAEALCAGATQVGRCDTADQNDSASQPDQT